MTEFIVVAPASWVTFASTIWFWFIVDFTITVRAKKFSSKINRIYVLLRNAFTRIDWANVISIFAFRWDISLTERYDTSAQFGFVDVTCRIIIAIWSVFAIRVLFALSFIVLHQLVVVVFTDALTLRWRQGDSIPHACKSFNIATTRIVSR